MNNTTNVDAALHTSPRFDIVIIINKEEEEEEEEEEEIKSPLLLDPAVKAETDRTCRKKSSSRRCNANYSVTLFTRLRNNKCNSNSNSNNNNNNNENKSKSL